MKKFSLWAKVYILSFILQIALFTAIHSVENDVNHVKLYDSLHFILFAVSVLTPSFFRKNLDRGKRWGIRFLSPGFWYFLGWAGLMFLMILLAYSRRQSIEPG
ncbi:MAG: hypothetical protein LBM59_06745 [Ruminococcus sp.]|jgi:hypothetical protein|nr:hypothetical protein [Ruminococcus sp.]